jgi:hypothetical protein
MSTLRLFIISPYGKFREVISGFDMNDLIAAGEEHSKKNPRIRFGIADEQGIFIWPEGLANRLPGQKQKREAYHANSTVKMVKELPPNCLECPEDNCRLPFSKVLPNRKISDFTYKRHPKCSLRVETENSIRSNVND